MHVFSSTFFIIVIAIVQCLALWKHYCFPQVDSLRMLIFSCKITETRTCLMYELDFVSKRQHNILGSTLSSGCLTGRLDLVSYTTHHKSSRWICCVKAKPGALLLWVIYYYLFRRDYWIFTSFFPISDIYFLLLKIWWQHFGGPFIEQ